LSLRDGDNGFEVGPTFDRWKGLSRTCVGAPMRFAGEPPNCEIRATVAEPRSNPATIHTALS